MAAKIIPFRTYKLSRNPDDLSADVPLDSDEAIEHSVKVMRDDFERGMSINDIAEDWELEPTFVQSLVQPAQ